MISSFRSLLQMWPKLTAAQTRAGRHQRRRLSRRPELEQLETRLCPALPALPGNNWMAYVPNATSLAQMSLPGTHDTMTGSATITTDDLQQFVDNQINSTLSNLGLADFQGRLDAAANGIINGLSFAGDPIVQLVAQTQTLNLQQQLNEGVRALDIRVQPTDDGQFKIVHGSLPIGSLVFDSDVLQVATHFLAQNPTETIVMQVQVDSTGSGNSPTADQIFNHYELEINPESGKPYSNYIWQATSSEPVPATLGEARGKIVIIQSKWNPPDPTLPDSHGGKPDPGSIFNPIQNTFATANLNDKWQLAQNQFVAAARLPNQPGALTGAAIFAVNFLSTSDPLAIFTTSTPDSPIYALPEFMATGSGFYLKVNLPTSLDGVIADLKGNFIDTIPVDGPGMNSFAEYYINSEAQTAPLGIVFTDFAPSRLIQAIYAHNPFPVALSLNGTLTLNAGLEPAGAHTIIISQTAAGGVDATVDSVREAFDPGQVTSIVVQGGPTSNTVDLQSIAAGVTSVHVQGQGNSTTLETPSGSANFWQNTGVGSGTIQIGSRARIVTFAGITNESGRGPDDVFSFDEGGSVPGNIDGGAGNAGATLNYWTHSGPVTVNLQTGTTDGIGGTFANIKALIGRRVESGDTLIGPNAGATWLIRGPSSGTVSGTGFNGFENLTGGSGNDQFVFSGLLLPANVAGNIDGGGGTNTLDYSNLTTPVTVNLQDLTATGIGGTFANIAKFIGGSGALTIDVNGPVVTQPGSFIVGGETFIYAGEPVINGATAIDAAVVPLYPPPGNAFVAYYIHGVGNTTQPAYMSAEEHFVQLLYLDELGRAGTLAEVDNWATLLDHGWSRAAVANGIEGSLEARDDLVKAWYASYLGRQAQRGEELGWVDLLKTRTEEQVLSDILGTPEFFKRAQTLVASGTSKQRYEQALYQVLLGRSASSAELAAWDAAPASLGSQGVAVAFLQSKEFRTDQFDGYYNALLHRPDDKAGLDAWEHSSQDIRATRIAFELSPEFYSNG